MMSSTTPGNFTDTGRKVVGGLAIALGGAALFNHWSARRAEQRNPPIGTFMDIDGLSVHHVDTGSGSPVVLLHGNGGMAGDYEASGVISALGKGHRVVAFDRPGFGYTPRPRTRLWTPIAQAALAAKLMRRLESERR